MSWLSNLLHGKTKTPDTSTQVAEADRQYQLLLEQVRQQQAQQQAQYDQQRADDQARYQQQFQFQQQQAEQQRAAQEAEINRQVEAQKAIQAQQQAERDAVAAQAAERARAAREYSTKRQGMIDSSTAAINSAYAGFDSTYFNNFAQKFIDYYKPQLEREATDQQHKIAYGYADTGSMRSSAYAKSQGDLERGRMQKEGDIAAAAKDQANTFENSIIGQKNTALSQLYSAGATANPILPDGTVDLGGALSDLGSQIGAATSASTRAAQAISAPSFTVNPLSVSLAGIAKRPTAYGVAS